jgi:hypothetical protein
MQSNTYGPMAISMRRENQGNLLQTLAVDLSRQNNWGQVTMVCIAKCSNHGVTCLVTISVPDSRVAIWRVFCLRSQPFLDGCNLLILPGLGTPVTNSSFQASMVFRVLPTLLVSLQVTIGKTDSCRIALSNTA